jgi:hypothetical protein
MPIMPFFKIPTLTRAIGFQRAVRDVEGVVDPTYQHANRLLARISTQLVRRKVQANS